MIILNPDPVTTMHSRKNPSKSIDNPVPDKMRREPPEDDDIEDDGSDAEAQRLLPRHVVESPKPSSSSSSPPTQAKRIGTALFYAISSIWVIFVNKIVLSTYKFPSVLTIALLQFASTTLALRVASALGYVSLLPISLRGVRSILPLSTCYLLNILTGLSATQNLSLPMMVLLRRASILMTMVRVVSFLNQKEMSVEMMRNSDISSLSFFDSYVRSSKNKNLLPINTYQIESCWRSGC
jgi:hypothetical protein